MLAIRALFLLVGAALGVFYPFVAVILRVRGLGPEEVGLVTGAAALAFTVAVPVWGHLADVVMGRTRALQLAAAGAGLTTLGLLLELPTAAVGLVIVIYAVFQSTLSPLVDALAVNALASDQRSYARLRLLTSLGFAAPSIVAGFLYDRLGYGPAPVLFCAASLVIALIARRAPDVPRLAPTGASDGSRTDAAAGTRTGASFGVALRIQPRLPRLLLGLAGVHVGMLAGFTYLSIRLVELGAGPSAVALSAGISGLSEIPAMYLISRVIGRTGLRAMLVGGMCLYAACLAAWAVLDLPWLIVASRVVSGFALSAVTIPAVMTIAALLPARLQATGQGMYQTVGFGVSAIVANAVGGIVYGAGGPLPLFAGCAVLSLAGAVIAWSAAPARGERVAPPEA
jgi:PPP family 3-phenylpropionic acid transporter